jgi:hypothetical protein
MTPKKTFGTIQMNLLFCDSKPMILSEDKQRELTIALADLLLKCGRRAGRAGRARMNPKISADHLKRRAIVYICQSSPGQVIHNQESQRQQYALADRGRQLGFQQVEIIDEDLGRSGSGQVERPGFQHLVAEVCTGQVDAVLCIEASRLARNGRDWHHLIELCGLVRAIVIDPDGVLIRASSMIGSCLA